MTSVTAQFYIGTWLMTVAALILWLTVSVASQTPESAAPPAAPFVLDVLKGVALDPTTYAPGLITYSAMRLDWDSSQVFFRNGYVEQNASYTVSGVSNTASISQRAGNRRIAGDSLGVLQLSLLHNVTARILERGMAGRHPTHRKLLRVAWRIERIAVASYLSYIKSSAHFRQWRKNERMAQQLEFK